MQAARGAVRRVAELRAGVHGVGSSVVNALSSRLDVEVDRDGKTHHMSFHQGHPGVYTDVDQMCIRDRVWTVF